MTILIRITLFFATIVLTYVSYDKLGGDAEVLDYINEQKGKGAVYPVKEEKPLFKILIALAYLFLFSLIMLLFISIFAVDARADGRMNYRGFPLYSNEDGEYYTEYDGEIIDRWSDGKKFKQQIEDGKHYIRKESNGEITIIHEEDLTEKDFNNSINIRYIPKAEDIPFIHTPWNSHFWEDTAEREFCLEAGKLLNDISRGIGKWFGKQIQNDIDQHQKHLLEQIKENNIIDYTILYEDYLHNMDYYKELEQEVTSPEQLTTIIDHLKKQKKSLERDGKHMNKKFVEYIEDLEHIRDYWQKEQDAQRLSDQSTITIIMGTLAIIAKILMILSGAGA